MENNYSGKKEPTLRIYGTLKEFIGENKVYKPGDVLCVSSKNNEDIDLILHADGKACFKELLARYAATEGKNLGILNIIDEGDTLRIKIGEK